MILPVEVFCSNVYLRIKVQFKKGLIIVMLSKKLMSAGANIKSIMSEKMAFRKVLVGLLYLLVLTEDFGTLGLRLNVYQYIVIIMFGVVVAQYIYKKQYEKFFIPKTMIFLFVYIILISLINPMSGKFITRMGFFGLEMLTLYYTIKEFKGTDSLFRVLYNSAFIIAVIGIVQWGAYFLKIPVLYDFSIYGLATKLEIRGNMLAVSSLLSEPSHCLFILAWAAWLGIVGKEKKYNFVNLFKTVVILLFALLTQSFLVYLCVFCAIIIGIFISLEDREMKKRYIIVGVSAMVVLLIFKGDLVLGAVNRLKQFQNISTTTGNDLSALALVSNLRIAFEKMKDGHILGTGFNTHDMYYYQYIEEIYGELIMYLNVEDAGSIYIRIFSEFGIVGLVTFLFFLGKKIFCSFFEKNYDKLAYVLIFAMIIMRTGAYHAVIPVISFLLVFFI